MKNEDLILQFYKHAASLTELLVVCDHCFVKLGDSPWKRRKVFLSNTACYVVRDHKLKQRLPLRQIASLFLSIFSPQILLKPVAKSKMRSILIDHLVIRQLIKSTVLEIKSSVNVVEMRKTNLQEYISERESIVSIISKEEVIDLCKMRKEFANVSKVEQGPRRLEDYCKVISIMQRNPYWILAIGIDVRDLVSNTPIERLTKARYYTVKMYKKIQMENNEGQIREIVNERKLLEETLSPYVPVLVRSFFTSTTIYLVCEHYKGYQLLKYLDREILPLKKLSGLFAQIVTAIGQIHECQLVYNSVTLEGVFAGEDGYILLNDFSKCKHLNQPREQTQRVQYLPPEAFLTDQVQFSQDWWGLGQLIYQLKEGRPYNAGKKRAQIQILLENGEPLLLNSLKWKDDMELFDLMSKLLEKNPIRRLGSKGDYHEVLNHSYFKQFKKSQLMERKIEGFKRITVHVEKYTELQLEKDCNFPDPFLQQYTYSREIDRFQ